MITNLAVEAQAIAPYVIEIRHELHSIPETRYETPKTRAVIRRELGTFMPGVLIEESKGGIVANIGDIAGAPRLLFRADFDALPIAEKTGLAFISVNEGKSHACGHDCHTAMLLGLCNLIGRGWVTPKYNLRLVFQDAEENPGTNPEPISGGDRLVQDGVTKGVERAYAIHVWNHPTGKPGVFLSRPGGLLGNSGRIKFAATSTTNVFPIRHVLARLNSFLARRMDPIEPATLEPVILKMADPVTKFPYPRTIKVTITAAGGHVAMPNYPRVNALRIAEELMQHVGTARIIRAGTGSNVLPSEAVLWFGSGQGSLPMFKEHTERASKGMGGASITAEEVSELPRDIEPGTLELWYGFRTMLHRNQHLGMMDMLEDEFRAVCHDVEVTEVKKMGGHPALLNDAREFKRVVEILSGAGLTVEEHRPMLGGEDFAHVAYSVPSCMWMLGTYREGTGDHHQPNFDPDESVLWKGVQFWALLATN